MFPNPWATSVPPPVTKSMVNSYENNTQSYPFYSTPNAIQNMSMNQQNSMTLNAASVMTQSLQPNAIDPAMVQKWQEWKQWELWQQQFQQWQQQTGQISAAATQPAPTPIPSNQPLQSFQQPTALFQNQQYPYTQAAPPLPPSQPQQINPTNDVGMKRGLEPEFQNNEKKIKIDTANNKKEIEINNETEALFEEQFKSWEEQFLKWKEQNKNHPDKAQYLEYEKKWLNWRDNLKQKCDVLKRKRELKMAEKKKEATQNEENKFQSEQRLVYNPMMSNVTTSQPPPTLQILQNSVQSTSGNQIPGLDLVSSNENITKGFLNVTNILPQNQKGHQIETPDEKPFDFPKSITNPTTNPHLVNMPHDNMNQLSTSMYQNSSSWSRYKNPVPYYNQKPPEGDNNSRFGQQTDIQQLQYGANTSNTIYNSSQNAPNTDFRRPLEGSYNKPSSSMSPFYNKPLDDQPYNRNLNASSNNYSGYNQPKVNTTNFNNFNNLQEKSNIPYQQPKQPFNTTPSKPPSLLSLNLVKPISLDKPRNYLENKNVTTNSYEKNWNIADDIDDPENEYMEAHKKFSSEPFDDQNDEDMYSNQNRNLHNQNYYSRGQHNIKNFNNDYSKPLNNARGSQVMRNIDNEYHRPNSQFLRNRSYSRDMESLNDKEDDYYNSQNNMKNMNQGFHTGAKFSKDDDEKFRVHSNEQPITEQNNFVSHTGNYGPPLKGNYESSRNNFGKSTSMEWDNKFAKNERPQQPVNDTSVPILDTKKPYEAAPPINPIKIFDYRHLPTLKVIPGLSKETVVPIRIFDYKHGGKRILPWQDRGFSRRNISHTRDLNEKEDSYEDNTDDFDKDKETLITKPTLSSNNTSSDVKDTNQAEIKTETIKQVTPPAIADTIIILDDDQNSQTDIESNHMSVPSPPKVSIIKEIEKPSDRQLLPIETLLCPPGRLNRPSKIVIILRGLPGSGKSYVAKLIKEKEVAMGGQAPRILSLDDYFMTEVTKIEIDPETNKKVEKKVMEYEYDSANENLYRTSFIKAFKKKISENYFSFYIIDAINNKVTYYKDILQIARANGFTVYIIELESDVDLCIKRNIHNRTAGDINNIMRSWVKTPDEQILLNIQSLINSSSIIEVEDVSDVEMELDKDEEVVDLSNSEENKNVEFEEEDVMQLLSCKWVDTIPQEEKMKRLDGLYKKKPESSIKEWLQIPEDDYTINEQVVVKDGKKRVRWADMEERREQEKMRAIGFVVGQTDWDRMLGRDQGESKLTQTKYI